MITGTQVRDFRQLVQSANCGTLRLVEVVDKFTGKVQTILAIVRQATEDSPDSFFIPVAVPIDDLVEFMQTHAPVLQPDGSVKAKR